jgi:phenylacetate-coenzyme A ligase PaaK-like adenylate-forming protein
VQLTEYERLFSQLSQHGVFSLRENDKLDLLLPLYNALNQHHKTNCKSYQKLASLYASSFNSLSEIPFLAVSLFKQIELKSISDKDIFKVLQSSGTTSQTPARVFLDRATSNRQSKVLVKIMQEFVGKQRLPMLIIDSPSVMRNKTFSARAAGIQGMTFFGRKPVYALNEDMSLNWDAITQFSQEYAHQPVLLFGFTFMVWVYFVKEMQSRKLSIDLPRGVLIHSGGWKKLLDQQVDNDCFKKALRQTCGLNKVHNFYGMAEQVGTVFVECEAGYLHAPAMSDIIIRDPVTLAPVGYQQEGIVQVLSALPTSYPGFSLLTEDLGTIIGQDTCQCGRMGKYFTIAGRIPKAEVRGCSDTFS